MGVPKANNVKKAQGDRKRVCTMNSYISEKWENIVPHSFVETSQPVTGCVFGFPLPSVLVETLTPSVIVFGWSKEVIKVKWSHKWGPWSNRISVLTRRDTRELPPHPQLGQRKGHVRTQQKGRPLQARKRPLPDTHWRDLPRPERKGNKFLLLKSPSLWCSVMAAQAD